MYIDVVKKRRSFMVGIQEEEEAPSKEDLEKQQEQKLVKD